ncbi:hydroxyethylthiazole kinase [Paludicola sp. MB14-C6]|uniref:hydroxyethylthiazole kinase n=1 Tax=Paludihabitans sp. MB14-C6 TaxID=3070656 RepID=UPI0027DAE157|nr:hydroxyethylthiazole kinase [Paludicola sp. MB14-C6]WMJ23251.1 hydroxyethylthiazole kinase [Paludicola sp. MB14-C6]
MINRMQSIKSQVINNSPLIHCITNPISINDCANAVLAVGAKPIMAEHPQEVAEITANSAALAVNLGNITDVRMESMMISGKVAHENYIPSILDAVGVGCSKLRLGFAKQFIQENKPTVIKGNMSEIKTIAGVTADSIGIDVGNDDRITVATIKDNLKIMQELSQKTGAVILATGETDLIVLGSNAYLVENGVKMLSGITGTGCMLNVLIACYLSSNEPIEATILATTMLGIAGELAETQQGTGSFHVRLLDFLSIMTDEQWKQKVKLTEVRL